MSEKIKTYLQPAFLVCVVILGASWGLMSFAIEALDVHLKKEPLPLRKSLDLLDENGLGPYQVVSKSKIENRDTIKSLGTEDYIEWILEDTEAASDSAVRRCSLFITYYELPDRVPHVPEECYVAGGHQSLGGETVGIILKRDHAEEKVNARHLLFSRSQFSGWGSNVEFPVMYLIRVNGKYTSDRNAARTALNTNLFSKYAYFSKVEWRFSGSDYAGAIFPDKEEAVKASEKLLNVILPLLEENHWPLDTQKRDKEPVAESTDQTMADVKKQHTEQLQ